jgi:hypothetical protein
LPLKTTLTSQPNITATARSSGDPRDGNGHNIFFQRKYVSVFMHSKQQRGDISTQVRAAAAVRLQHGCDGSSWGSNMLGRGEASYREGKRRAVIEEHEGGAAQ